MADEIYEQQILPEEQEGHIYEYLSQMIEFMTKFVEERNLVNMSDINQNIYDITMRHGGLFKEQLFIVGDQVVTNYTAEIVKTCLDMAAQNKSPEEIKKYFGVE